MKYNVNAVFAVVSSESPETLWKPCAYTKLSHQLGKISILPSDDCRFCHLFTLIFEYI